MSDRSFANAVPMVSCCLAVLLVVTAAPAVAETAELSLAVVDSMPLPIGVTTGLAWVSPDTVLVLSDVPDSLSDTGERRVILTFQNPWGDILRQEDFTGTLDRGLAWDGEFIWACGDEEEGGGSLLYRIEPDTCIVQDAFATATHRPCGLCFDGEFLWMVDRDSGRLTRFDPKSEMVARSIVSPGFSPYGIAFDGTFTWVCDSGTGQLYRLYGRRRQVNGVVAAVDFDFRGRDVVLGWGGAGLHFVPEGSENAYLVLFQ